MVKLSALTTNPLETAYLFSGNKAYAHSTSGAASAEGGAIYNSGTMELESGTFTNNSAVASSSASASAKGGAIYNSGTMTLGNAIFTNNSASADSSSATVDAVASGGAIYNSGTMTLGNAIFTNNSASADSSAAAAAADADAYVYGGVIYNEGRLTLTDATFTNNSAVASSSADVAMTYGGAIYNDRSGTMVLGSAAFTNNSASADSSSAAYVSGGAIYNSGTMTLESATFTGNSVVVTSSSPAAAVANGGAIFNTGTMVLTDATFTNNSASATVTNAAAAARANGGAIDNGGTIALNINAGNISLFTGNITSTQIKASSSPSPPIIVASSIYMRENSTLNVNIAKGGLLDMRDPMSGNASGQSHNKISQQGSGVWKLGGNNVFDSSRASGIYGKTTFAVDKGTLYLYRAGEIENPNIHDATARVEAGKIQLNGADSSFTLAAGAKLTAGGGNTITTTAGKITLEANSTLGFNVANATNASTAGANAILGLTAGNFTIGTSINIDLLNLNKNNGNYTLVTANNANNIFSGKVNTTPTLRGEAISGTRAADAQLSIKAETASNNSWVTLTQGGTATNAIMDWNTSNGTWNITAKNWQQVDGTQSLTQFLHGDIVNLKGGTTDSNITINEGGVSAAAIYLSGGKNYAFSGGGLTTDKTSGTLSGKTAASGKLVLGAVAKADGTFTIQTFGKTLDLTKLGANNSTDGIDIYSGTLKVASAGQLGTSLNKLRFLSIGSSNIGTLQISGNVVLEGARGDTQRLEIGNSKLANITLDSDKSLTWQNSHNNKIGTHNLGGALYIETGAVLSALTTNAQGSYLFAGNSASTTSSTSALGGAIYNSGTLTLGNAAFTGNSVSTTADSTYAYGGAIYNEGTLTLNNASFTGNSASVTGANAKAYGSAIFNNGTITLNINAGNTSLFTGNITNNNGAIAASSIYMLNNSTLNVNIAEGGKLDMRDPMGGNATKNTLINISQQGAGTWKLGGDNIFTSAGTGAEAGKTTFAVNEGTLYLYRADEVANSNSHDAAAMVGAGKIQLDGAGSSFTLAAGATLAAGGGNAITTAGNITLHGGSTLGFDVANATAEAAPTSNNAILNLNATNGLTITGSGKLNIDLLNLNSTAGDYTLVYANGGNDIFNSKVNATPTLRGEVIDNTRANGWLSIKTGTNAANDSWVALTQDKKLANALMNWDKTNGDNWNITDHNWQRIDAGTAFTQFLHGDIVNFKDGTGGNITINAGGVGAAAIYVSGTEDYTFSGNFTNTALTTDKTNSTLTGTAASGKLVLGAMATDATAIDPTKTFTGVLDLTGINGANNFTQGVDIHSGTLKVANANQLGTSLSKLNFLSDVSMDVSTAAGNLATAINNYATTPNVANKTELDTKQTAFDTTFTNGSKAGTIGTLQISGNVVLEGANGDGQRLAVGTDKSGHIVVDSGQSLTWQNSHNIKINQGDSKGGALFIDTGAVVVLGAATTDPKEIAYTFSGNTASSSGANAFVSGGAIFNSGSLVLGNASFSGNTASSSSSSSYAYGGAIDNRGNLVLSHATFSGNTASSSGAAEGGAIYNGGTLTLNNVTFSGNTASSSSSAHAYGGAIYNSGSLVLSNASFTGNTAASSSYALGGAIYNSGSLVLNVDGGMTSLFTGNITDNNGTIAASALYMRYGSTLDINIAKGGVLDMRDPMGGGANWNDINISQQGAGVWKLGGDNIFTESGGKTTFAVNEGTLHLYRAGEVANSNSHDTTAMVGAGRIQLEGTDSSFTLGSDSANTTLVASGGNAITTDGTIVLNTGDGSYNTTLSFGLTDAIAETIPTSTHAILNLKADQGLSITGGGKLNIDLQDMAASNGTYTLLYNGSPSGAIFSAANVNSDLTLRGQSVASNSRLDNLRLTINDKSLVLNQNHVNALATWTGAATDGVWDILSHNWSLTNESGAPLIETQFISGDAVRFNDTGNNQTITVHSGGVTPAGLVVNSGHDYTFSGGAIDVIAGGTLSPIFATGQIEKQGQGTLTFNNQVSGAGHIYGGTMIIGDSIVNHNARFTGNVDIYNGATLGGHGQIAGLVTAQSGATIAPGNSIGTLSVGDILFQSGSTYQFEGNIDGSGDKIIASNLLGAGTARIDSGVNLSILAGAGTWNAATTYSILEADNGVQGQFDHIQTNLAFLTPSLNYSDPNKIGLTLSRNTVGFNHVGRTFNQRNTGLGIQSLSAGHPVYNQIVSMNNEQAQNAFDNLSGEIHASIKSAALNNSRYTRNAINQHLTKNAGEAPETERNLWVNTWYHDGHLKGDGNAQKLDNKGFGIMMGVDALSYGATTLGVALGYEQAELKLGGSQSSSADMDSLHLMAYGRTKAGPIDIRGAIGYSLLDIESKRNIGVGSLIGTNRADYEGSLIQAYIEGSHTFKAATNIDITPYINLAYQRVKTDSFTESAGLYSLGSQLKHKGGSDSQTITTLGVRGQWRINNISDLYADIGWQHAFGSQTPESSFNFIGGQPYRIKGVKTNRNAAVLGIGANFQLTPKMQLSFGYEGHLGDQSRDHSAKLQWRLNF